MFAYVLTYDYEYSVAYNVPSVFVYSWPVVSGMHDQILWIVITHECHENKMPIRILTFWQSKCPPLIQQAILYITLAQYDCCYNTVGNLEVEINVW